MAADMSLRPIANLVEINHPERPTHTDKRAEIDKNLFEPLRAFEAAVDQQSVKSNGMAQAQREHREASRETNG